jgi:site-specific DNA recombinase
MSLRAAMYPRVSTDMQRDNYSIPSQVKDILEYARIRDYVLVGDKFVDPVTGKDTEKGDGAIPAFVDDYTSTELSRPGLNACLSFLKDTGFDVLLVHAVDRLARDPYFRQTIEREVMALGARVEYVLGNYDESPEGEVRKDLDSTFAKWENAKRVERSNRGKKRKAEMGKFVSGKVAYGYRLDPDAFGGIAVHEREAGIVQLIFNLFVESKFSIQQIADELNRLDIKSYYQFDWASSSVQKVLANTMYVGYFYYNKYKRVGKTRVKRDPSEWIKIECTPIIPPHVFEAAQTIRKHNREYRRKLPKRFYMLSGMVFCMNCERPYSATSLNAGRTGYRHRIKQGHCSNRWRNAKELETLVWDRIVEVLLDPSSLRKGYEKMMEEEQEKQARRINHLEAIQKGIEKLQAKRSRLQQIYIDPDIGMTKEEYLSEKNLLEDQINAAHEEMERIEKDLTKVPTERDLVALEEMASKIVRALGNNLDIAPENKREVFKMLNLKVLIALDGRIKIEGWFTPKSDGLLPTPS